MNRQRIIDKVKYRIDELGPVEGGELFGSEAIELILNDAANRLLMMVPPYIPTPVDLIDPESSSGSAVDLEDGVGYIPLVDGYLKLVSIQLSDWERACTEAISENDPRYALQKNTHVRGGPAKPVVVYRYRPGVGKVLEYYTSDTHEITHALCLKETLPEDLDDFLAEPLSWLAASIVLETRGEQSEKAMQKVVEWIQAKAVV